MQPTAASATTISGAEVNAQPFARPGEALEVVPGLIVTQHSGEGKANQYFLRGFNLDHGTDLAIKIDGMPVNMPTHGHGQGYADINFMIPELIQSVNVRKGPYFADVGDFGSAGSLAIDYINRLPKNILETTNGTFGYHRGLAAGSTAVGAGTLLAAVEGVKYNGPWDVPDNVRKLNGVLRYSQGTATDGFTLSAMAYSNGWNSTDQVAQRAIDQSIIGRFGTLDPTDGGTSSRFSLSSNWAQSSEYGQSKINAYVIRSSLQLYNNFTYFLDDPVNGDQFSQIDRRTVYGLNASHAFDVRVGGIETQTRVGLQTRGDDIRVGLFKTLQRETLSTVREDSVREGNVGLWADTTARWTDWLRTTVGIREDYFAGRVAQRHAGKFRQRTGVDDEPQGRHRAGAVVQDRVLRQCRLRPALQRHQGRDDHGRSDRQGDAAGSRAAAGSLEGRRARHSHQGDRRPHQFARGVRAGLRIRSCCSSATPAPPSRAGPAGASASSGPTSTRSLPWMTLDLDVAYTRARFTDFDPAGDRIPGAPAWIASGGVTFGGETGWFGALRGALFRSASPDRGRQRPFAGIADLQCARGLQIRQRPAAAARRAQSLQREDQPDRILLSVAIAGRADRRCRRSPCSSGRAAGGAADAGGQVLGNCSPAERSDIRDLLRGPGYRFAHPGYESSGHQLARLHAALRRADRDIFDGEKMFRHGDAFDHGRLTVTSSSHFSIITSAAGSGASSSISSGTSVGDSTSGNTPNSPATSGSGFCLSAQCKAV